MTDFFPLSRAPDAIGTLAVQDADAVDITGGDIAGVDSITMAVDGTIEFPDSDSVTTRIKAYEGGIGTTLSIESEDGAEYIAQFYHEPGDQTSAYASIYHIATETGIVIGDVTDADIDLITVLVTGAPAISWDESEDKFSSTHGIIVTATTPSANSTTGALVVDGGVGVGGGMSIGSSNLSIASDGLGIEINTAGATADTYIDFHSENSVYTDYSGRLLRTAGENGNLELINNGTGAVTLKCLHSGEVQFYTSNTLQMKVKASGFVNISNGLAFGNAAESAGQVSCKTAGTSYFFGNFGNESGTSAGISKTGQGLLTFNDSNNDAQFAGGLLVGGSLQLGNAYTAGAPTPTGYLVLKDSAGTSYKIPAEAL